MDYRTSPNAPRPVDRRSSRRALLAALLTLVLLASALISPLSADAASGKPQVWGATGWASRDSCSNGTCSTTNGHGDYRAVAVGGRLFAPYSLVKVQVTNWLNASDVGTVFADASGNIWYVSNVPICAAPRLPFFLQAYDWVRGMWSTVAVFIPC